MSIARRILVVVSVLLTGLGGGANSYAVEFGPALPVPASIDPGAVVVGDFNGDGKADIAAINSGHTVSILLGNGDGTFQTPRNFDLGNSMTNIVAGDFNGDGKLDIAAFVPGNATTAGEVRILLGKGDGTLQAPVVTALTVSATVLKAGDFTGDKIADLILSNVDPATQAITFEILIGKGDGTFQPPSEIPTVNLASPDFAIADFNNDGRLDLALAAADGAQIHLGRGNGTFQPQITAEDNPTFLVDSVWVADVNGDGIMDVIINSGRSHCAGSLCSTEQEVGVFLGNGDGTFRSEQILFTGGTGRNEFGFGSGDTIGSLVFGDFNGDGKVDLADRRTMYKVPQILGSNATVFEVRLSAGGGTFATPIPMPDLGTLVSSADFNGDKLADLLVANGVLLNTSATSGVDLGIIAAGASREPVGVGVNLTYSSTVVNEGPQDATGVTFADTLPRTVTFVSATSSQGTCTQANLVVTCVIGALSDTADAQVGIVVIPTAVGTISNTMILSGSPTDSAPANNDATQNTSVVPSFHLIVTKVGNGTGQVTSLTYPYFGDISCGSTCTADFATGTVVHLNQTADAGSFFQNWGGACSGSDPCAVTMTADATVTANFVAGVTLSVTGAGVGTGTITSTDGSIVCGGTGNGCSSVYAPGTSITLSAAPTERSLFGGWSGACTGMDPNNCNVTINSNESVTATFNLPPDFAVDPGATSLSVKRGSQISEALTFPAQGGFSGPLALTCVVSGGAPLPTCSVSPNPVPSGSSATLTINTAGLSAALAPQSPGLLGNLYEASLSLGGFGLLLIGGLDKKRRGSWLLCLAILVATLVPTACGSSEGPVTPSAQSYVVTVTATAGQIQHSTTISVSVN